MKITSSARKLREEPRRSPAPLSLRGRRRRQRGGCAGAEQPAARSGRSPLPRPAEKKAGPKCHPPDILRVSRRVWKQVVPKPPTSTACFKRGLGLYLPPRAGRKSRCKIECASEHRHTPPTTFSDRFFHSNINDNNDQ